MLPVWRYAAATVVAVLALASSGAGPDRRSSSTSRRTRCSGATSRSAATAPWRRWRTTSRSRRVDGLHDLARQQPGDHHVQLHATTASRRSPAPCRRASRSISRQATTRSDHRVRRHPARDRGRRRRRHAQRRHGERRARRRRRRRHAQRRAAASTSTSARQATTRSTRATASPSGSRAAPTPTASTTTSSTSSPSARRGTDNDGDGFSTAVDCNDAQPQHLPRRARPRERHRRGLQRPGRPQPRPRRRRLPGAGRLRRRATPAIRPNAIEVRGNAVDENCDRRADPFAELPSLVSTSWKLGRSRHAAAQAGRPQRPGGRAGQRLLRRRATRVHAAARTHASRSGATWRPVFVQGFFGRGRFRPGARITVAVTAAGTIGRTYTYRIKRGVLPLAEHRLQGAGGERGSKC